MDRINLNTTIDRMGVGLGIVVLGVLPAAVLACIIHAIIMPAWLIGGVTVTMAWASYAPDQKPRE